MDQRILIIINNLGIGGAERLTVDDTNEMLRMGVDVRLVTLRPEPKKSLSSELRLKPNYISSWIKLILYIREFQPDLVITQLWFANTIGRVVAWVAGARRVISFEQNVYDTVKTRKMFFVDWLLQPLSTKIIAVSEAVKKSLTRHKINEAKIDVLHNGVDISKYGISNRSSGIRKEYGIPENAFLYMFIGRLIHQKAVDVLIEAFKEIDVGSYLLLVGQGIDRDSLEQQVKDSGLESRVIFAGVRKDIPELLGSSDCFVLPSRHEGLPMVLIEALAAGTAIVVSDFEAVREVITHEKDGLIVPREDFKTLAQAMRRIKDDDVLRKRLSAEAKKTAENFSISNHVSAMLRYIDN